jgi:hypothetical protein
MAKGVVDQLEVVDVDDEQRDRLPVWRGSLDRGASRLDEGAAQRQSRQFVNPIGHPGELRRRAGELHSGAMMTTDMALMRAPRAAI